jgi:hypothetical protein
MIWPLGRFLTENDGGQRDDQDQPGREREDGVERKRRSEPRGPILVPLAGGLREQRHDLANHADSRARITGFIASASL